MARKVKEQNHFSLRKIKPLTPNQEETFKKFYDGKHLLLHGVAGTGKTFISLYLALNDIIHQKSMQNKIVIIRSVVPSRDMGFLPGNVKEKTKVYEEPYRTICDDLFGRGDGYDILKIKNMIEFGTTSFLRGITFHDSIVIVDEMQNLSFEELFTIMTRIGENCRIIFCGDYRQSDLKLKSEKEGIKHFMGILRGIENFNFVEFEVEDIVRSSIVKAFIMEYEKYRQEKNLSI